MTKGDETRRSIKYQKQLKKEKEKRIKYKLKIKTKHNRDKILLQKTWNLKSQVTDTQKQTDPWTKSMNRNRRPGLTRETSKS